MLQKQQYVAKVAPALRRVKGFSWLFVAPGKYGRSASAFTDSAERRTVCFRARLREANTKGHYESPCLPAYRGCCDRFCRPPPGAAVATRETRANQSRRPCRGASRKLSRLSCRASRLEMHYES